MSILDDLLAIFFGKKKQPAPAPKSPPASPKPPPATTTAPKPAPPSPPVSPPAAPPPAPPPPVQAPATLSLSALVAKDKTPLSAEAIAGAAQRLGVEATAIQALIKVQSGGPGFAADGRPIILFDPVEFSELTNRAYDAAHPNVSQSTLKTGGLGNSQADRWAKLTEAFALDQGAALKATSWGAFQMPGENFQAAGYANIFSMISDLAQSETRQLVGFEQFVRAKGLAGALNGKQWEAFALAYGAYGDPVKFAAALANAYAAAQKPPPAPGGGASAGQAFIAKLVAQNAAALTAAEISAAAARMNCEDAAVRAVLKVESRGRGFSDSGLPIILYEPHVFSRLTGNRFDATNPNVSYKTWKEKPYPATQEGRYAQLAEAYDLNPEAAVSAASWGLFQILGQNFKACGFGSATAFVLDMAKSEARMLAAFEQFVRSNNILDDLQTKNWAEFARVYNGPGQVPTYSKALADAYAAAGGVA